MSKILKLNFFDDITIDEIYDELFHYKKLDIMAECYYDSVFIIK